MRVTAVAEAFPGRERELIRPVVAVSGVERVAVPGLALAQLQERRFKLVVCADRFGDGWSSGL